MKRSTLREIISDSCRQAEACGMSSTATDRLIATADEIDYVAVGTFVIHENPDYNVPACGCPATNAGFFDKVNQCFTDEARALNADKFPGFFDKHFASPGMPSSARKYTTVYRRGEEFIEIEDDE